MSYKVKGPVKTCDKCGKLCFVTRKMARTHMRKLQLKGHTSIYKCGEFYHFGHTPYVIQKGKKDRRDYCGYQERDRPDSS